MAERKGLPQHARTSAISSRTGEVRLISMGLGAHGMTISSAYCSADRAMAAWSSICGVSMITTSSFLAISGSRRCSSREGRATIRNGNAACAGASRRYMATRSDHSTALPEGSASTRSRLFPACAKTCASQTAEVVLPVPGLKLARARLSPVIQALSQRLRHYGNPPPAGFCQATEYSNAVFTALLYSQRVRETSTAGSPGVDAAHHSSGSNFAGQLVHTDSGRPRTGDVRA